MFDNIAHSYDGLNHLLSLGIDRKWRKNLVKYLKKHSSPSIILDVATGTGDLAILTNKMLSPKKITGIDISEKMLEIAQKKTADSGMSDIIDFRQEDCARLSFEDNSYDAVVSAFALRNFENLDACLKELYRVLRPGGHIAIIDLCAPKKFPMKQLFWCYKKLIMPVLGHTISHDNSAYTYLPDTMQVVPQGKDMAQIFSEAGFKNMRYKRLSFQMCMMYTGQKSI